MIQAVSKVPIRDAVIGLCASLYGLGLSIDGLEIHLPPLVDDLLRKELGGQAPVTMPIQLDVQSGTPNGGKVFIRRARLSEGLIIQPNGV